MNYSNPKKNPGLSDPPPTDNPAMMQWMKTITDILRQGTGQAGSDKWATLETLVDKGVLEPVKGPDGKPIPPTDGDDHVVKPDPPGPPLDDSPPPAPLNVSTSGSPTAIRILWDDPGVAYSYRAEVFFGIENDVGKAVLAGSSNGTIYEHIMGTDTKKHYFWVRFVKGNGLITIVGPWNQTAGTPGQISGKLKNEQLGQLDVDKLIGGTAHFVQANILNGSITNAKIGDTIQSNNYIPGQRGWIIKK